MSQNIIDVSWDWEKFNLQTQSVLKNMQDVVDKANEAGGAKVPAGSTGGYTELKAKAIELNAIQTKSIQLTKLQEQATQAALRTRKLEADAIAAEARARKLNTDAAMKEAKAKENAAKSDTNNVPFIIRNPEMVGGTDEFKKRIKDEANDIGNATTALNEYDKAQMASAISATEFGNNVNKSNTALKGQSEVSKLSSRELERQKEIQKQLLQQDAQALKLSVREQLAEKGSLDQRRAALIRLTAAYDNLNAAERNSAYGVRMQKTVSGLTEQVKVLEMQTGRASRNVWNYANGVAKGIGKAYNGLRKLAYLIPGLGIGGLVLMLIEPLTKLFNLLTKSTSATVTLAEKTRILGEVQEESVKGYGSAAAKIEILKSKLDDLSISESERVKYAKEYNSVADEGNKIDTTQLSNISLINSQIEAQIKLLKQRALALGATNVLAKKAEDVFNAQLTLSNDQAEFVDNDKLKTTLDNAQRILDAAAKKRGETNKLSAKEALAFIELPDDQLQQVIKKNKSKFKILEDAAVRNQLQEIATRAKNIKEGYAAISSAGVGILKSDTNDLQDAQREFDKALKVIGPLINTDTFSNKGKGAKGSIAKESTKESLDLVFELYKISQQRKLKLLDEEANDTKNSFGQRMSFAEDYYNASKELAEKEAQHEIDIDKIKLKELQANLKKAKGTERNNLLIDIENEKKQITLAIAKKNDAIIGINEAFAKRQEAIAKDELARQLAVLNEAEKSVKNVNANEKGAIEASHAATMASLDTLLKEKKIKQDFYDQEKEKSIKNMEVLQLQSDLRQMESTKAIMILKHEDIKLISSQIEKQKSLIISAQNTAIKPGKGDLSELDKRKEIMKDVEKATQLTQGLVDIKYQKEIDAIQKIIDLNNYRKEQEMKNISQSSLSNQEKAAQMIVLDNAVAANNRKLERQQAAIKIKQAKFDRDMAILGILENVAGANFKLIAQGGFAGIAAGIAVGLEAAAAIAMLLAKPLPTMPAYATGTDNHPGGPAIVGEGRFKELVETGGGSFIADRPMLLNNLPKGSKVTPLTSDVINEAMYSSMMISTAQRLQAGSTWNNKSNDREIIEAIENGSRMTVQAMRKQRGANVNIKVDGYWGAYITKSVKE